MIEPLKNFSSSQEENQWFPRHPKPGEFFKGTISRVTESGGRVIEVESKLVGVILVDKGKPGDEVEIRLTKKSGDNLIGRVIENNNNELDTYNLSEDEKKSVKEKFESVEYNSNRNDILNGDM